THGLGSAVPLGLKCHTPIQRPQQQQQQQQQSTPMMMMSGSQRMLTTLAAALKATTSGATTSDNGTGNSNVEASTTPRPTAITEATMVASAALALAADGVRAASVPSREVLCGGAGGVACGEINGNPTTPTASAATSTSASASASASATSASTTFYTNVMGNCNSHKNNGNSMNDNKCYNNNNSNCNKMSNSGNGGQKQQQEQPHQPMELNISVAGPIASPGTGRPPPPLGPASLFCGNGTAMDDFNLSIAAGGDGGLGGGGGHCNDGCNTAAMYSTNTNNNNSNNNCIDHNGNSNLTNCLNGNNGSTNNANNNSSMFVTMQSHGSLLQKQQQQQQQQQHIQMHFDTHSHTQFPIEGNSPPCNSTPPHAGTKCDSAAAVALGLPMALPLSLSLHLPMSSSALTCRTAAASDATQCAYCCQPICDRYIMRVVDTSFHEGCLKCATCALHLLHSCYARDGKLYCRIDYERQFLRNRCLGCGHRIASDELVMRTFDSVFHLKCFACVVCGGILKKGEQYVVKQGQLFCRLDYEKEVEMLQGYDFYGDDLFTPKLDGRRGPKRPRTILNTQQRRAFKASFELSPKPCRKVRENLAKETGLSLRIVQVWFQNQRAKVKKIQKKAKQEHSKGASDSQDSQESDSSNLAKIKDEAHSDSESLLDSPFSACIGSGGSGGGGSGGGGSGVGVGVGGVSSCADGAVKMRSIKDENENTSFNCMETNKENCNKMNEPFLSTVLGLSYSTFQQLMGPLTQSPMVNPIDRLYSMQNSYFRPEELGYSGCSKDLVEP
ncbi:Wilms tumor protein 1-interacting protein homolog, partial [Rhagoletis pomonella]|uniref:Wilms tumor protein 1-interacting protein homolog n=1 Tax=Rhagoletis pomonella TaxID=28610 RepID=UPI00177F55DA